MTDRPHLLDGRGAGLNIRRLMYQTLIWAAVAGDEARGLSAPLNAENMERSADALIHGVVGNLQLSCDFFRRKVLIDQTQTIELAGAQPSHPVRSLYVDIRGNIDSRFRVGHPSTSNRNPPTDPETRPSQQ